MYIECQVPNDGLLRRLTGLRSDAVVKSVELYESNVYNVTVELISDKTGEPYNVVRKVKLNA